MTDFNPVWISIESSSSSWEWLVPAFVSLVIGLATIWVLRRTLKEMERVRKLSHEPRLVVQGGSFDIYINFDDKSTNWFRLINQSNPRLLNAGSGAALDLKASLTLDHRLLNATLHHLTDNKTDWSFSKEPSSPFIIVDHKSANQFAVMKLCDQREIFRASYLAPESASKSTLEIDLREQAGDSVMNYLAGSNETMAGGVHSTSSSTVEVTYESDGKSYHDIFKFSIQLTSIGGVGGSNTRKLQFNTYFYK